MGFVDDDELEGNVYQDVLNILVEHLVRSYYNLELEDLHSRHHCPFRWNIRVEPFVRPANRPPFLSLLIVVGHCVQVGPLLNRALPMGQRRQWRNHEEGSSAIFKRENVIEESDGLDSFAQAHFIGENDIPVLIPGLDQPVETVELVVSEQFPVFVNGLVPGSVLKGLFEPADFWKIKLAFYIVNLGNAEFLPFLDIVLDFQ